MEEKMPVLNENPIQNPQPRSPYTFDRVVRIIFSVVGVLIVVYFLDVLQGVLLPFLVACLISYMLEPLVKWNMRWMHLKKRFIPVIMTLLETSVFIGLLCWIFIPYIVNECTHMADVVKAYASEQINIPFVSDNIHKYIRKNINFEQILKLFSTEEWHSILQQTLASSWSFLTSGIAFIAGLVSWLIVILYVLFIMLDYDRLMLSFRQLIPHNHRHRVNRIMSDITSSMNRYFRGQFFIAMTVGVLFSIGFLIIGLPMAVVLGLFIGVLNMVPYLQLISLPLTAILCLVWTAETGGSFWMIFWEAMAVYIVVQCIQDLFLTPKIMGKAMGLNPAIILLSLSIWGSLLGFMGLIIALPLTTLLLSYYNLYVIEKNPI